MIAIDTDLVLAFLTNSGSRSSRDLVIQESRKSGVFISYAVLFELAERLATLEKERVIETFSAILQTSGLVIENNAILAEALETFRGTHALLTDCMKLSSAAAAGVTRFYTQQKRLLHADSLAASP